MLWYRNYLIGTGRLPYRLRSFSLVRDVPTLTAFAASQEQKIDRIGEEALTYANIAKEDIKSQA